MDKDLALKEAIVSAEIEGFSFSEEEVEIARKIIDGDMSLEEYFVKILAD